MWLSALVSFALGAFKWLFGERQQQAGVTQGKAEQALDDVNQEMLNEQKAQAARQRAALSSNVIMRDDNNSGPASRR
jgi:hypothetical protein